MEADQFLFDYGSLQIRCLLKANGHKVRQNKLCVNQNVLMNQDAFVVFLQSHHSPLSHEVLGDFHLCCKSTDSCFLVLQVNHNKEANRVELQFGFHSCETVSYFALELVYSSCLDCSFCGSAE